MLPGGSTRSVLDVQPFAFRIAGAAGPASSTSTVTSTSTSSVTTRPVCSGTTPPGAAAVRAALERGWTYGGVHVDEIRFAEAVCAPVSVDRTGAFHELGHRGQPDGGSARRHHTGRDRIVVVDGAYHGGLLYFGHGGEALLAPFDFERITYNDVDGWTASSTIASLPCSSSR